MKLGHLFSMAALVAASLLLSGGGSRAATVSLPASLNAVNGNQALVGDKTFDFLVVQSGGSGGGPPSNLSNITVLPETPGLGGTTVAPFGFGLQGAIVNAANGTDQDLSLTYTVTSSNGPITAVNLTGVGSVTTGSTINIAEVVLDPATNATIGSGGISGAGSTTIPLTESLTSIKVQKNILASTLGQGIGSNANYSIIDQTFSRFPRLYPSRPRWP